MALIVGPLGGWLASRAFGITVGIGAALLFSLVPAGLFLLREPRTADAKYAGLGRRAGAAAKCFCVPHDVVRGDFAVPRLRGAGIWNAAVFLPDRHA